MTEAEVQARLAEIVTALRLIGNYSAPTYVCDICGRKVSQEECEALDGICDDGENDCPGCFIEAGGRCERLPLSIAVNLPKLEGWLREHKLVRTFSLTWAFGPPCFVATWYFHIEPMRGDPAYRTASDGDEEPARALAALATWEKLEEEKKNA